MTWIDYAVLTIVGISVLLSVLHGFVRELLALAAWITAFVVAQLFAVDMAAMLPRVLSNPSLRVLVGFLCVFLVVLLTMTLIAILVSKLIRSAGLGAVDRMLGALFGMVRGLVIVMVAVLLAGLTSLPRQPAWRHAMVSAPLVALAKVIKGWLPYELSKHINYE
jgi:membrane protein required for colicin V production